MSEKEDIKGINQEKQPHSHVKEVKRYSGEKNQKIPKVNENRNRTTTISRKKTKTTIQTCPKQRIRFPYHPTINSFFLGPNNKLIEVKKK